MADDPGVTKRSLTQREMFSDVVVRAADGLDGAGSGTGTGTGTGTATPPSPPEVGTPTGVGGLPPPPPQVTAVAQPPVAPTAQPVVMGQPPSPPAEPVAPREKTVSGEVSGYRVRADGNSVEGFRENDYASAASSQGGRGKDSLRQPVSGGGQDPEGWVNT